MKIVIDVPTEHYNEIVYEDVDKLRECIKNGILLPKGYGRLIDGDELVSKFRQLVQKFNKSFARTELWTAIDKAKVGELKYCIRTTLDANTIIPADKEVKDEKSN